MVVDRPREPGEGRSWDKFVNTYNIVDKNTFEIVHELPRIPREWRTPNNVNGLGHVFSITDHPFNYYYIPEDAYEWLGRPPKGPIGNKHQWPQLPGFVFIGGQKMDSEGRVYLYVDKAGTSEPQLSIHEQDTDNRNWVRWGAWRGKRRMMSGGNEDFMVKQRVRLETNRQSHTLTDEHALVSSSNAWVLVRERTGGGALTCRALSGHSAHYCFDALPYSAKELSAAGLVEGIKQAVPSSKTVTAPRRKPIPSKVRELLVGDPNLVVCDK